MSRVVLVQCVSGDPDEHVWKTEASCALVTACHWKSYGVMLLSQVEQPPLGQKVYPGSSLWPCGPSLPCDSKQLGVVGYCHRYILCLQEVCCPALTAQRWPVSLVLICMSW